MGRIALFLLLLTSTAYSQGDRMKPVYSLKGANVMYWVNIPGYTNINARYKWIATAVDSGLHVPQYNGVPTDRVGVWTADGCIAADTLNGHFYYRQGGVWVRVAKYSEIGSAAWSLTGNSGTTAGTNFLGTTDAQALVLKTNNAERARFTSAGVFTVGSANRFLNIDPVFPIYQLGDIDGDAGGGASMFQIIPTQATVIVKDKNFIIADEGSNSVDIGDIDGWGNSTYVAVEDDDLKIRLVGGGSQVEIKDSVVINPKLGRLRIDTLNYTLSTTGKKLMIRDTATGLVQNIDPALLVASTGIPISSLTAATGTNSINNPFNQNWEFDGVTTSAGLSLGSNSITTGTVFSVQANGTAATSNSKSAMEITTSGANATSTQTTYGATFSNTSTGTSSTNVAGYFASSGGSNNYAIIVPPSSGSVGIGTSAPTEKLEVVGGSILGRWKARVGSTASSGTPTINTDNTDIYKLTALAANITSFTTNLTGTPNDGDILEIQITDDGTPRTIAWGASFADGATALPVTTVASTTLTVILQYYTTSSYGNNKWICASSY